MWGKENIASIFETVQQDRLYKDQGFKCKKNEAIHVLEGNMCKLYYNMGIGNSFLTLT